MSESLYYFINRKRTSYTLYEFDNPSNEEDWIHGVPFKSKVVTPVLAYIRDETNDGKPEDFYPYPTLASERFYQALLAAGVDNIDAYDAYLYNEEAGIHIEGYKALNIIGTLRVAGKNTQFKTESRLINASIDQLEIDPDFTPNLLMFRMAEAPTEILVHKSVKNYLEGLNLFPNLEFTESKDFFTIG